MASENHDSGRAALNVWNEARRLLGVRRFFACDLDDGEALSYLCRTLAVVFGSIGLIGTCGALSDGTLLFALTRDASAFFSSGYKLIGIVPMPDVMLWLPFLFTAFFIAQCRAWALSVALLSTLHATIGFPMHYWLRDGLPNSIIEVVAQFAWHLPVVMIGAILSLYTAFALIQLLRNNYLATACAFSDEREPWFIQFFSAIYGTISVFEFVKNGRRTIRGLGYNAFAFRVLSGLLLIATWHVFKLNEYIFFGLGQLLASVPAGDRTLQEALSLVDPETLTLTLLPLVTLLVFMVGFWIPQWALKHVMSRSRLKIKARLGIQHMELVLEDPRKRVLFLRNFADETVGIPAARGFGFLKLFDLEPSTYRLDWLLADELGSFGPCLALGPQSLRIAEPGDIVESIGKDKQGIHAHLAQGVRHDLGEGKQSYGVTRKYLDHDNWKGFVEKEARKALVNVVCLDGGETAGLAWECEMLQAIERDHDALFVFHPSLREIDENREVFGRYVQEFGLGICAPTNMSKPCIAFWLRRSESSEERDVVMCQSSRFGVESYRMALRLFMRANFASPTRLYDYQMAKIDREIEAKARAKKQNRRTA